MVCQSYDCGTELSLVDGFDLLVLLDDAVVGGVELDVCDACCILGNPVLTSIELEMNLLQR